MSVEELLKPRFKVEFADYPESDFTQGQIIEFEDEKQTWFTGDMEYVTKPFSSKDGCKIQMTYRYFCDFPKVFRLMEWHEERKKMDMPEYIRLNPAKKDDYLIPIKKVFKVYKWDYWFAQISEDNEYDVIDNETFDFLPATKEDYENQNIYE